MPRAHIESEQDSELNIDIKLPGDLGMSEKRRNK